MFVPAIPGGLFFAVIIFAAVLLVITALLQWLWNITIPTVFNLKNVTFWQAFRLLIIAGILFGGFGARLMR